MIPLAVVSTLLVIALLVAYFLRPTYEIVPEEQRVIIYRLGRFERVAGPGIVVLSRDIDEIKRRYSVRNEPHDFLVDGLMPYGVPMGLTLNMWWSYDPQKAAAGDKATLANLALFTESERRSHLAVKLRDSLVRQISALEQRTPLGSTATVVDKIMPMLPGAPTAVEVLQRAQQDLARSLPALGIFLDVSQPIVITRLHVPDDLIKGFSRDRVAELLSMRFPGLPDSMMVHMLESIEGLAPLRIQEIRQVGNTVGAATEARWTDEDGTMVRVPLAAGPTPPPNQAARPADAAADQPVPQTTQLGPGDLAVLKRVSRETSGARRVA